LSSANRLYSKPPTGFPFRPKAASYGERGRAPGSRGRSSRYRCLSPHTPSIALSTPAAAPHSRTHTHPLVRRRASGTQPSIPPPWVPLGPFQGPLPPPSSASADCGPHRHTTGHTHPHTLSVCPPAAPPATPGDAHRHSTHTDDEALHFCRESHRHQSIHLFVLFFKRLERMFGQNHSYLFVSFFVSRLFSSPNLCNILRLEQTNILASIFDRSFPPPQKNAI